jgi:hypothetical protein
MVGLERCKGLDLRPAETQGITDTELKVVAVAAITGLSRPPNSG